jgi:hypothetical protein
MVAARTAVVPALAGAKNSPADWLITGSKQLP